MRTLFSKFITMAWAIGPLMLVSCSSVIPDVNLIGEANVSALRIHINNRVCITGVMNNDDLGLYILLAPFVDEDGVIQPSPPRIQIIPAHSSDSLQGLVGGQSHRVCGILKDITPSKNCQSNDCKWYELRESRLGRPLDQ